VNTRDGATLLLLLRHGIAEDAGPSTGFRDEPRALTPDGIARMRRAARGMAAMGLAPDLILTSPLTRCLQTAEIVNEAVGGVLEDDPRLAPGMEIDDLVGAITDRGSPARVLVCGHQPDMSYVTAELVGGGMIDFRKGTLAALEVEALRPRGAILRGLYPASTLRRIA
jgi:phosphohistidine phosphatase